MIRDIQVYRWMITDSIGRSTPASISPLPRSTPPDLVLLHGALAAALVLSPAPRAAFLADNAPHRCLDLVGDLSACRRRWPRAGFVDACPSARASICEPSRARMGLVAN